MLETQISADQTAIEVIPGYPAGHPVVPNMGDYAAFRSGFSWERARRELDGLPAGGLNIAHEAVDRHAAGARADQIALRWLGKSGAVQDFSYARLSEGSNRFANVLRGLGVGAGERVYILTGRIPELYIAALGAWKNRSCGLPLFSAFGPEPIRARMAIGDARVLVTTPMLYQRKIVPILSQLPGLGMCCWRVSRARKALSRARSTSPSCWARRVSNSPSRPPIRRTPALLHFTSGTTGTPKGAVHVHEAVVAHHATGKLALDLHPDDVFWCTADPGWVTGTSYGIIAPLSNGVTSIVDEADFDAERWYGILEEQKVTRLVHRAHRDPHDDEGRARAARADATCRPCASSPASASRSIPRRSSGAQTAFGLPFHDNWWQTETGGIMIANFAAMDMRPGSMGKPLPGIEAAIVRGTTATAASK